MEKAPGRPYYGLLIYKKDLKERWRERDFTKTWRDRTKGNGFKLKDDRFRLVIRKKILTIRVVRHWRRFPRKAVDVLSLEVFKVRLDAALSNLV